MSELRAAAMELQLVSPDISWSYLDPNGLKHNWWVLKLYSEKGTRVVPGPPTVLKHKIAFGGSFVELLDHEFDLLFGALGALES